MRDIIEITKWLTGLRLIKAKSAKETRLLELKKYKIQMLVFEPRT